MDTLTHVLMSKGGGSVGRVVPLGIEACKSRDDNVNLGHIGNNILCSTYAPADQGMSISTQKIVLIVHFPTYQLEFKA